MRTRRSFFVRIFIAVSSPTAGYRLEAAGIARSPLAASARSAGIERAVFDRGGRLYHGRVRALAEGAREGGLEI